MQQVDEELRNLVALRVVQAALDTAQPRPGGERHLNVNETLRGMCQAIAMVAATIGKMAEEREQGAMLVEVMAEEVAEGLQLVADKIRSGEIEGVAPPRPKPRLVK